MITTRQLCQLVNRKCLIYCTVAVVFFRIRRVRKAFHGVVRREPWILCNVRVAAVKRCQAARKTMFPTAVSAAQTVHTAVTTAAAAETVRIIGMKTQPVVVLVVGFCRVLIAITTTCFNVNVAECSNNGLTKWRPQVTAVINPCATSEWRWTAVAVSGTDTPWWWRPRQGNAPGYGDCCRS